VFNSEDYVKPALAAFRVLPEHVLAERVAQAFQPAFPDCVSSLRFQTAFLACFHGLSPAFQPAFPACFHGLSPAFQPAFPACVSSLFSSPFAGWKACATQPRKTLKKKMKNVIDKFSDSC